MENLNVSAAPHICSRTSTKNIMLDVLIALLPATVASIVIFGMKAVWIILACVISAVLSEFIFNLCIKKKQTIGDLSAVVTGLFVIPDPTEQTQKTKTEKSKQKSIRRQQKPSQIISCSKHCQYHFMKDVGLERKPGIADTASGLGDTA